MEQTEPTENTRDPAPALPTTEQVAERINTERQRVGLAWPQYAALLQFNQSSLYKIASGQTSRTHVPTLRRLVDALDRVAAMTPEDARRVAIDLPVPAWAKRPTTRAGRKRKTT